MRMKNILYINFLLIWILSLILSAPSDTEAQIYNIRFDFKNTELKDALELLIREYKIPVVYMDNIVKNRKITAYSDGCNIIKALNLILKNTSLSWKESRNQYIVYKPVPFVQNSSKSIIKGRVTSESTGEPLSDVNVFIADTFLGAATDENGEYTIYNVSHGQYSLIASIIGYELFTKKLKVTSAEEIIKNFSLPEKVLRGKEITIESKRPKKWLNELKRFKNLFLGESKNAKKCKILNPEILDFSSSSESDMFMATARDIIKIENMTLGYKIDYYLQDFIYDNRGLKFKGITKFEPVPPKNNKEEKTWKKNRYKTYQGSLRHLLKSICDKKLEKEKFTLYSLYTGVQEPKIAVKIDTVITDTKFPSDKIFHFGGTVTAFYMEGTWKYEKSVLYLSRNEALIDTTGYLYNPYDIYVEGVMGEERIADKLPKEYDPNERR